MRTERNIITAVLGGFCALGALSSIVPAVAVALLGLLALVVVGWVVRLWWTTRTPTTSTPSATRPHRTPPHRTSPNYALRPRAAGGDR